MTWPAEIAPRIRLMLALILANQEAICGPKKGTLELHFNGRHVTAHLVGHQVLERVSDEEPSGAA